MGRALYIKNRDKRIASAKKCAAKHADRVAAYDREYRAKNKDILQEKANVRRNKRIKNDPFFKLRIYVSTAIFTGLKNNNGSKCGVSIILALPYTIGELKLYLESLFEPWMTWENRGRYVAKKWDDNDPTTWRWQLDHIIPQADLPYDLMEHPNFKKCWALSNLRPLSAKTNVLDGIHKVRHNSVAFL
jgi:hypothetical protein